MDRWILTGVSKSHSNIGIVYRDTTQADYEFSDVHNSPRSSSSGASTQLDTGESFFIDETKKPLCGPDDVFFDLPPANLRAVSNPKRVSGGPKDKTLLLLEKPVTSQALSHSSAPNSHDLSPTTAVLELWERNETFQDLTQLIEEEQSSSSSLCFPPDSTGDKGPAGSLGVDSGWMTAHPYTSKRPFSPCDSAPFASARAAKACRMDCTVHPPGVDQYTKMRVRNNEASKRSRMTRKEKEQEMELKAQELEQENQVLSIQVKNLEEVIETLKKRLINAIVKK